MSILNNMNLGIRDPRLRRGTIRTNTGTPGAGNYPGAGVGIAASPEFYQTYGGGPGTVPPGSDIIDPLGGQPRTDSGLDPAEVEAAAQGTGSPTGGYDGSGINPNNMYGRTDVGMGDPSPGELTNSPEEAAPESALSQLDPVPADTPPTGMLGFEDAVARGYEGGMTEYENAIQSYLNAYRGSPGVQGSRDFDIEQTQNAINALSGYNQGGAEAQRQMAALSGALGPEAQSLAMANFQESPGQRYLREQTERGVLRNAAAVGGLGGGNVLKALQANAAGLAAQDFQNQFNRLGNVANRGMSAAGRTSDLYSSLGGRQAGFRNEMGSRIAEAQMGQGDMAFGTGGILGANRQRVGDSIAANIQATANAVAANQSGQALANLLGADANALVNLITAAQSGDAASSEALAAILANIATSSGSQVAGRPSQGVGNDQGLLETIGKAAGGIGTAMAAMPSDPLLKTDINKIGTHNGHNLYSWRWNEDGRRLTGLEYGAGVMADEVLEKDPAAVSVKDGYLHVNYSRIF